MWRYLALATAIVVGACIALLALPTATRRDPPSRYASDARASAGPSQHDVSHATPRPVEGDAPWAFAAFPECFAQRTRRSGTVAFARALLRDAHPIARGAVLQVADCTVVVGSDSAIVTRGENRLRVPPPARFFARDGTTIVERRDGVRDDVRVYAPRNAGPVSRER